MKHNWINTRIEEFVHQSENIVEVKPNETYSLLGMSLEGRGLFLREQKQGIEISSKNLNKVMPGEFIYSRLFAWKGAFDFVRDEYDGTFVSDEYPAFILDETKADVKFLHYYFNQKKTWKKVEEYCIGVTKASRNRFKEGFFLNLSIPLPPLFEQQRIVAKIDSIKSRIEQIQRLRAEQEKEIYFLRNSIFIDLQNEFENVPIGKFIVRHEDLVELDTDGDYKQVTVKMEHKGVLLRGMMKGSEIGSKQYLANEGDFIISKIDARNGAMGFIPEDLEGAIVTGDFPLYNFSKEINPKFFYYFSNTLYFDKECKNASEGTTNRKRLKLGRFENILIPYPPRKEQNKIVSLLDKLNELTTTHRETEKELSQLMPALLDKAFKGEL